MPVAVAPEREQSYLCEVLEALSSHWNATVDGCAGAAASLGDLERSTLAKAFRGELVEQDLNDEPAGALLERIQSARERVGPRGAVPRRQRSETVASADNATESDEREDEKRPGERRPASAGAASGLSDFDHDTLHEEVFAALWTLGPLKKPDAIRRVADHLRQTGRVRFERLRSDGALYSEVLAAIDSAAKAGHLDRPQRGYVRACKPDPTTYSPDDWHHALISILGRDPADRDDAIRSAAEWARNNLGLEFARLRSDGCIVLGIRSAIDSAVRRGQVRRHGANQISRTLTEPTAPTRR